MRESAGYRETGVVYHSTYLGSSLRNLVYLYFHLHQDGFWGALNVLK